MQLIWRETALDDLDRILAYIGQFNFAAAERLQDLAEQCAQRLIDHPYMYRTGRIPETREALIHPNYLLVYRVSVNAVEIVNVLHSRQLYPPQEGAGANDEAQAELGET
jgi:toxin ParE1/3/4